MDLRPLLESAAVRSARARARALDDATLQEQLELAQIPAPPGQEAQRAERVRRRFVELGLEGIAVDEVGNVLGRLPATPDAGRDGAPVLVSAHLDTVFPLETALEVRREGERYYVPGISDNSRGLAALLTLAQVLGEARVPTCHPLVFVATVGEEGSGDLRGVKHLFRPGSAWRAAAAFVSLDGSGVRRIVHRAVGSKRLRARVVGPGGHSWSDWGLANPLNALGTAIEALMALPLPASPRTTLTVARAGGGTSVNAIPAAAWMELDLRSEAQEPLATLERAVQAALREAVESENRRRRSRTPPLVLAVEVIGDRPGGSIPSSAPLVRTAVAATRALGVRPEMAASSTDANVPISLGIPAVTLGAGGDSGGIHTTGEWYSNQGGALGVERALLLLLATAGATTFER